jgi:hypothetical protein
MEGSEKGKEGERTQTSQTCCVSYENIFGWEGRAKV